MNILLIGGNGFIGSHLIDVFMQNGHKVRVFDIAMEKYRTAISNVDYRIHSIDDLPALYESMINMDVIFHLASSSVPSTSNINPMIDVNGNLITSINVLNAAAQAKVKKIVYFSSGGAIYGPTFGAIREDSPLNPISSYGIIKSTIEKYFLLYSKLYNIETIIFRPSNPFGPRQGHVVFQGVISTFLRKIIENKAITIFGNGKSAKDYIYIQDLAIICYHISINKKTGIYNVGTGIGTTLDQLIFMIKKVTNSNPRIDYEVVKDYDVPNFVLDISEIKKHIGNFQFTNLEEGIFETWQWIQSQN